MVKVASKRIAFSIVDFWVLIFLLVNFCHLRVVLLYIYNDALICWAIDLAITFLTSMMIIFRAKSTKIPLWLIFFSLAILVEFCTAMLQGINAIYIAFTLRFLLLLFTINALAKLRINIFDYRKSFLAISVLHLSLVLFKLINPNSAALNRATGYGSDNAEFLIRATGGFISPGVLAFYSSILLLIFLIRYWYTNKLIDLIIAMFSLFLGLATLNRGFLIPLVLLLIFLLVKLLLRFEVLKILKWISIISIPLFALFLIYIDLITFLYENFISRFDSTILAAAVETRLIGRTGALSALKELELQNIFFPLATFDSHRNIFMVG
ncbi:MAG: hypothetical protein ACJ0DF_06370, partial [Paracoccaceae bacterium]